MKIVKFGCLYVVGAVIIIVLWAIATRDNPMTFTHIRGTIDYSVSSGRAIAIESVSGETPFEVRQSGGSGKLVGIGPGLWQAEGGNVTVQVATQNPVYVTLGVGSPGTKISLLIMFLVAWTAAFLGMTSKPNSSTQDRPTHIS